MEKKEIDQLITESLTREEAEFYDSLEEEGLFQKIGGLYSGKMRWMAIATAIVNTIAVIVSVYCLYLIFTVLEVLNISKIQHRLRQE